MRVHISLNVRSLEYSLAFYEAMLGTAPSKRRDAYANFRLDEPPVHLALQEGAISVGGGASHFGIELPDQESLAGWRSRLEQTDLDVLVEDAARCCYAKADKLWLTDPDGYRWEVWVRTGEHEGMGASRIAAKPDIALCCGN